jgi:hypothetical protein
VPSAGRFPLALAREAVCGSCGATGGTVGDATVSDAAMGDPHIGYQEIA